MFFSVIWAFVLLSNSKKNNNSSVPVWRCSRVKLRRLCTLYASISITQNTPPLLFPSKMAAGEKKKVYTVQLSAPFCVLQCFVSSKTEWLIVLSVALEILPFLELNQRLKILLRLAGI